MRMEIMRENLVRGVVVGEEAVEVSEGVEVSEEEDSEEPTGEVSGVPQGVEDIEVPGQGAVEVSGVVGVGAVWMAPEARARHRTPNLASDLALLDSPFSSPPPSLYACDTYIDFCNFATESLRTNPNWFVAGNLGILCV